jgi:hypothetical protein
MLGAPARPIEELRRQKHIAGRVLLLQTPHRRDANNPPNIQGAERVDVSAMIQLVGQQSMSAPMPRQKVDLPSMHLSSDDRIRGIAKRGFDPLLRGLFHALHLIKAASADDANGWYVSIHFLRKGSASFRVATPLRQAARCVTGDFIRARYRVSIQSPA